MKKRTIILCLLMLVYVMNFVDRQIIGILSPAIKAELGFSDTQLGLLKGFAFALLYVIAGIPIAWLADRYNRTRIVAISLVIWSGFTALTGMAGSFASMLLARVGVGIGEAGGSPPSHSIISDLYPKEERATALAVYSLGIPIGIGFSFLLAGALISVLGWRGVLIALGIVGVALALLVLLIVREPKRGMQENTNADIKPASMTESIRVLARIPSWWAMCMAVAFFSFGAYAITTWNIDYIVRFRPDYAPGLGNGNFESLMFRLGMIYLFVYSLGTYVGGWITEKLAKNNVSAYGWVPAVALMIGVPCIIAAFWVNSITMHLILFTIYTAAAGFYLGPGFAVAQTLAPVNMRAMSTALYFFVLNIIGLGGGPTLIGLLSESMIAEHGELLALRYAITTLIVPYSLSIIAFFWVAKTMPRDWAVAESKI